MSVTTNVETDVPAAGAYVTITPGSAGCSDRPIETFTLPGNVPLEMQSIEAGTFMMGTPDGASRETPVHQVSITQSFWIGVSEVTQTQWDAVMETTPWSRQGSVLDDPNSPATHVSWNDANTFIDALNEITGETFRLPTEVEWEYACRAGSATVYSFGDSTANMNDYAW